MARRRLGRGAIAATIAATLLGGGVLGARSPELRARFVAASKAFAEPGLVDQAPPPAVECGPAGKAGDASAVLEAAIARDFQKASDEDLEDPGGATLASLTLPDLKVPITRRTMRFVRFFARASSGRAAFQDRFRRGGRYRELIERELREAGLPEDLVWLAAIESGFNLQAASPAGASGLFQFMPETGAVYGLYVSPFVDERRSITRSTTAAVQHLRDLYERFRRWDLALAAYNMGYDGVVRAMDHAAELRRTLREPPRALEFADLAEARLIPDETANYVPQITAFAIVAANRGRFGLDGGGVETALELGEMAVPQGTRLRTIARAAGVSIEVIRDHNPQLLRDRVPPTGGDYLVSLPADRVQHALATFPAYADHEVLDAEDAEATADLEPMVSAIDDDPLPRRPIALGNNRLPRFEVPGSRLGPASFQPLAMLGAKLPVVLVGGGVGWQRFASEDPLGVFGAPRGQTNGKGLEPAVDKQLGFLGGERRTAPVDPFERFSLPNGLAVELRRDTRAPFVAITARLSVGEPRDAGDAKSGLSLGEARHTLTVAPRDLDVGLELALGRLRLLVSSSSDASLGALRRRATEPRRKALASRPYGAAWVALGDALYPEGSPLAGTALGARGDPGVARDLLLTEALRSERTAQRATLTLVGNVERARAEELLGKASLLAIADEAAPIPPHPREDRLTLEEAVPSLRVLYGWIGPGEGDTGDAAMRVAAEILCGPRSSRVEGALVGERLAASAHGELDLGARASTLAIELTPAAGREAEDVERALDRAIGALAKDGPTWKELALAKVLLKLRLEKERESAGGHVVPGAPLASSSARIRNALNPGELEARIAAIDAVTAPAVRSIVHRVLAPGHRVIVTTAPIGAGRIASVSTSAAPR